MGDLIERDAALARIDCCLGNSLGGRKEFDSGLLQARKFVINTPAVNRWIPCIEKKPEIWKEVLVTLNDKGYKSIHIGEMQEEGSWMIGGEFWYEKDDPRITHWMPLPEPPESEVQNV